MEYRGRKQVEIRPMNKHSLVCLVVAFCLTGCSKEDEKVAPQAGGAAANTTSNAPSATTKVPDPVANSAPASPTSPASAKPVTLSDLSADQVSGGLKEALDKGLQAAVGQLGKPGGFLSDPKVKIPMPEKLQSVEKTLRAVGQGEMADQFVATINQAAEQAVPAAATVFAESLKSMTVADAKKLLTGPNDAATQYFRTATEAELTQKFLPIVKQATANSGTTAQYKQIMDKAKATNPLFSAPSLDIDAYVTAKAMDGLFKIVAEQEKQIRENPVARTSGLLQSVFGAVTK